MNDKTAKILTKEERLPRGANVPVQYTEYACPCGQGKIIEERTPGFGDHTVFIECARCRGAYTIVRGAGHFWELKKK